MLLAINCKNNKYNLDWEIEIDLNFLHLQS